MPAPAQTTQRLPGAGDGRRRVVIEAVRPEIDCGRHPAKAILGEPCLVEADIFADGHDLLACILRHRPRAQPHWHEAPMAPTVNDRWRGSFIPDRLGEHEFTLLAWIDRFASWRRDLRIKSDAGQDLSVDLLIGAHLLERAIHAAPPEDAGALRRAISSLRSARPDALDLALSDSLAALMDRCADRSLATEYPKVLRFVVDPPLARFSAWYELFPRSASPEPGRHGTFRDCIARLDYIAEMGFDILYLPPIHPIGRTHRKGPNNAQAAGPDDVGSPWAIGAAGPGGGGHKAIHPDLGTLDDFHALIAAARDRNIHIALDLAYQCSPDHPYIAENPAWFVRRPDGSIQYAENPPKKYQDIYPFDFESEHWQSLWEELRSIVEFWIGHGVRIFRVDNPHTKALAFWEWMIADIKANHPDILFLSEAFTRPKVMYQLAKLGFSQSYTYFAWKNTRHDLERYFTEITSPPICDFFRPSAWPNTPDILSEYLQFGGRAALMSRLVLAATLCASYGIYGPVYELGLVAPREPGSEEYLDSEKYQLRRWELERPDSLMAFIARVNRIRRDNPALHYNANLRFHSADNDQIICYSKVSPRGDNAILCIVNLDPHHPQSGFIHLDPAALGADPGASCQMHDLLSDARYLWRGDRNYISLDPRVVPAHILRLRRRVRTERDFDYFA